MINTAFKASNGKTLKQCRILFLTCCLPTLVCVFIRFNEFRKEFIRNMERLSSKVLIHVGYWIFVIIVLTLVFGTSWGSNTAAFFFVCMLLPVVMGTSYFINYVLVPRFYLKNRKGKFFLYIFYSVIVSMYFEEIVLVYSFIYLGHFSFSDLAPNAFDTTLLAVILYLLVFIGTGLLMYSRIIENKKTIQNLLDENKKMQKAVIEVISNRVVRRISLDDIL